MAEKISRRDFLKLGGLIGTASFLAACGVNPDHTNPEATPQPRILIVDTDGNRIGEMGPDGRPLYYAQPQNQPTATPQNQVAPTQSLEQTHNQQTLIESLQSLGIRVELPNPNWPTSYESAAQTINGQGITPDHLTAIIETDENGNKVWRGWYMGEPAFPLKPGVTYDSSVGYHRDAQGNPLFDPREIFETDWNRLPPEVRNNFADRLATITTQRGDIAFFARTGGVTRGNNPPNTHYFGGGQQQITVDAVEQFSLIPVQEVCPTDISLSAATKAFRQAALEFRDNPDAKEGRINVLWFNPETNSFQPLDGRLIATLTKSGYDLSVLEKLPAGMPLSPEEVANKIGGQPEKWVVNPNTWEWFFEAFRLQPGINFNGFVHIGPNGQIMVRLQDQDLAHIFNFQQLDRNAMMPEFNAPGSLPAVLFARAGMAPNNPQIQNHSWYTWGDGNLALGEKAIEQATLMIVNLGSCPVTDYEQVVEGRAQTLAQEQPDPKVTALYWDGNQFIIVRR